MMTREPIRIAYSTQAGYTIRFLLLNQLLYLKRQGYEVTAICSPGPWSADIRKAGIELVEVEMTRQITPLADLLTLARLAAAMRKGRFHIVHTHTPKANLLSRIAARMAGVPVVVGTAHGFYFYGMRGLKRRFFVAMTALGARFADALILINLEDTRASVEGGITGEGEAIYLAGGVGVDLKRFDPHSFDRRRAKERLGLAPHQPVTGIVGRLTLEKGFGEFFRAAGEIVRQLPQARFLVVGPDDVVGQDLLESLAGDEGVLGQTLFLGARSDMPELYAAMDVVVLPSYREGKPLALMEAAAMGRPAVASDIRGCRDVVEHGRTGYLVPLGDVEALAGAILGLLRDRERAAAMGRAARARAEEIFDEEKVFEQVESIYRGLLRDKGLVGD